MGPRSQKTINIWSTHCENRSRLDLHIQQSAATAPPYTQVCNLHVSTEDVFGVLVVVVFCRCSAHSSPMDEASPNEWMCASVNRIHLAFALVHKLRTRIMAYGAHFPFVFPLVNDFAPIWQHVVVSAEFSLMSSAARIYNWIVKTERREREKKFCYWWAEDTRSFID